MTFTCPDYTFFFIKINEKAGETELINPQQTGKFLPTNLV